MLQLDFYEEFAEQYDALVSFENRVKREAQFFDTLFKEYNTRTILDCACGTGHHVMMFKQMGYDVKGSDLSPAMINKAEKNLKARGLNAELKVSAFKDITTCFKEKFDAVMCVGNSLPHLFSDIDLINALTEMRSILNENGILILEQRNYDKMVKHQERFIPVSFKDNDVFFYVLDYFPNKIIFNIIHLNTEHQKFKVYTTDYNPITKDKLTSLLKKSGLLAVKFYDYYDLNEFNLETSNRMVIVCLKNSH